MRRALNHSAERLERRPLALGVALLGFVAVLTFGASISLNGVPFVPSYRLQAVMPGASGVLKAGDQVRVAGRRVGTVKVVAPARGGRLVTFELEQSAAPVGRDALARLRQKGVAGAYYIELDRGDHRGHAAPEGWTIPRSRTSAYEDLIAVIEDFDKASREAGAAAIRTTGEGLLDRGDDLHEALGDLHPAARDLAPVLDGLRPPVFADLLHWSDRFNRGLSRPGSRDLERVQPAARATLEAFAGRREQLGAAIDRLRPFEDAARRTLPAADVLLADAAAMARELTPGLRALARTTPDVNRLLASGGIFDRQVRRLGAPANAVLEAGAPLLRDLRPAAASMAPLAPPLAEFAGHVAPFEEEIKAFEVYGRSPDGIWWFPERLGKAAGANTLRINYVFTCAPGRAAFEPNDKPPVYHRQECDQ